MDDLKFPVGDIPQDPPQGLPMEEYFDFVMFCRKAFPPHGAEYRAMPAPVRFVIREEGDEYSNPKI